MSPLSRLFREWAALLAVLAMALGPLASGVGRSLAAQERVDVAVGLVAPPLCLPGDAIGDLGAKAGGLLCDHCLPGGAAAPPSLAATAAEPVASCRIDHADTAPSALLAQLRLPPATGPPAA